jgi:hypothetical protein
VLDFCRSDIGTALDPRVAGAPIFIQATGPGQSLPLVLLDVSGPMQLAKLTSQGLGGWVFYEVVITRLD